MHWEASLTLTVCVCVALFPWPQGFFKAVASRLSASCLPCRHMSQSVHVVLFLSVALGGAQWEQISHPWEQLIVTIPLRVERRTVKTFNEAIAVCNPAAMVISSASPAADTRSRSERHCDHEQSVQSAASGFKMLQAGCRSQAWTGTRGTRSIHLLKSCHCSVRTWSQERGEWPSGRTHTFSHPWFYSPLTENDLRSQLVRLLIFAALIFHYL